MDRRLWESIRLGNDPDEVVVGNRVYVDTSD